MGKPLIWSPLQINLTSNGKAICHFLWSITGVHKFIGLLLLVAALGGCKPIEDWVNQMLYGGTLKGMSQCLEGMNTDLISPETAKAVCVSEYEQELETFAPWELTGRASPETHWYDRVFAGSLENKTESYVVTSVGIEVDVYEADGKTKQTHSVLVQGWFEPTASEQSFRSRHIEGVPDDWGHKTLYACGEPRKGRCWEWVIVSVKGLEM